MSPREALYEVTRENAQAGIEYAIDELRGAGHMEAASLLMERKIAMAKELADMDLDAEYEWSDAFRRLVKLIDGVA